MSTALFDFVNKCNLWIWKCLTFRIDWCTYTQTTTYYSEHFVCMCNLLHPTMHSTCPFFLDIYPIPLVIDWLLLFLCSLSPPFLWQIKIVVCIPETCYILQMQKANCFILQQNFARNTLCNVGEIYAVFAFFCATRGIRFLSFTQGVFSLSVNL